MLKNSYIVMIKLTSRELYEVNDTFYSTPSNAALLKYMPSVERWYFFALFINKPSVKDSQTYLDKLNFHSDINNLNVVKNSCTVMTSTRARTVHKHHFSPNTSAYLSSSSSSLSMFQYIFVRI